ncbi:MAG: hypothetical protein KME52_23860 [Desmonostoc geniculatum HA4340-LM1]|nr:hypothetical protein [Desmonostoc geniculatum HA4340-LM1]
MNLFSQNKFFRGSISCTASILGTVGLSAIAFIGVLKPVEAASISFIPPGSQLDGDHILDIETKPGDSQNFEIYLEFGANEFVDNFNDVTVRFSWDTKELEKISAIRNANFAGGYLLGDSEGFLTLNNLNLNKIFPIVHCQTETTQANNQSIVQTLQRLVYYNNVPIHLE